MHRLRLPFLAGLAAIASLFIMLGALPSSASALSGSQFDPGRIIDDSIFFNPNSMNQGDIQAFLNSKVPVCDTNGDLMYAGQTRRDYSAGRGYSTPFTCLKDYRQDTPSKAGESGLCNALGGGANKPAAQIIYEVSQVCGINPKVLIVLLQKEQTLVTDDWPWSIQYRSATGYGCPDTAPCDAEYYGFFNQVYNAARQFKRYGRDANLFNYKANTSSFVGYNPSASCGGTGVFIQNRATAALYNYTPYQPNAAALNNLYGTGDSCSAYGNRNFWRMFNDWFGNTTGPDYAWSIDNFYYSGSDNIIGVGETETLTLKARNTGRNPWYQGGGNPVRLGLWGSDTSPLFKAGSWFGPNRPAQLSEAVVQPGEVGTFTFQITPNAIGTYVQAFNVVSENAMWTPWPGFSPTIQVVNPYSWSVNDVIYSSGGGIIEAGSSQTITVKALNTGTATWSKTTGPPVRLARVSPGDSPVASGWLSPTRAVGMTENTVAPGEVGTFTFTVRVPNVGNYYERMSLVAEGMIWFNDPGLTLYLRGGSYSWQPLWHAHSTGTANIPRGQAFTLTVKVKNTSEVAWKKAGGIPVRLATFRNSPMYHSSWLSPNRVGTMLEDSVQPGQTATFVFTATAPASPGGYNEHFSLVAEGYSWFNDPGFSIYVNSL